MAPKAKQSERKSPAEFFAEQKTIAGFDNPGKSLYTTMRELLENGLDSGAWVHLPREKSELSALMHTRAKMMHTRANSAGCLGVRIACPAVVARHQRSKREARETRS